MSAVAMFLEELQKRIDSAALQKTSYDNKRNALIEIDNIILTYGLDKKMITSDDLGTLASTNIVHLDKLLDFTSIATEPGDRNLIKNYLAVLELDRRIRGKYEGVGMEPSIIRAKEYIDRVAMEVTQNLAVCLKKEREVSEREKEMLDLPRNVLALFKNGVLTRPIFDFSDIDKLSLGMPSKERGELKLELYVQSYNLVAFKMSKEDELFLNKFKEIVSTKKKKYAAAYEKTVKEDIIFSDMDAAISLFEEQYGLSFADAKGAVTVLLLEKNITDYENTLRRADVPESFKKEMIQTIKDEMESVLAFSRKREKTKKVEVEENTELSNSKLLLDEYIKEAESIIKAEDALIKSVDGEKLGMFLAQSASEDTKEALTYRLASILISLVNVLNAIKDKEKLLEDDENTLIRERKEAIGKINDCIETYRVLRKQEPLEKIPEKEEDISFKVLYLTDNSGKDYFSAITAGHEKKYISDVSKLVHKLEQGMFAGSEKCEGFNQPIYRLASKKSRIIYMRLANNYILVLAPAIKSEETKSVLDKIVRNSDRIDYFIKTAKDESVASVLYDEQASIRQSLKANDVVKKVM